MKRYSVITLTSAAVMAVMMILNTGLYAQNNSLSEKRAAKCFTKNEIESLKTGIASENTGLSKNSIYFAGLYRISEAVEPLMDKLRKESDPATKILIGLSLYRIGDPMGLELVQDFAVKDGNPKVRRMFSAIYNEYTSPDSLSFVNR